MSDKTARLQTMLGADLTRYLELKAEMMGADAIAPAAKAILSEAMLRDAPLIREYLALKVKQNNDPTPADKS